MIKSVEISPEKRCYVCTLNEWTPALFDKIFELLKKGYYVNCYSTAIGHTLANMVENEALDMIRQRFGDKVEFVIRAGWGDIYAHLVSE